MASQAGEQGAARRTGHPLIEAREGGNSMAITRKEFLRLGTLGFVGGAGLALSSVAVARKQQSKTVVIQNFSFKPAHITIKRGTRVTWINKDTSPHTATAKNGNSFDSGLLRKGQRYSHTFKSAGKKPYFCKIHPHMKGSVTVEP
jgi:plastocyanin